MQDKVTGVILHHGKSSNNELFKVPVYIFPTLLNKGGLSFAFLGHAVRSTMRHQRLRHPSNKVLTIMLRASKISCMTDDHVKVCTHCLDGKMSKIPFPD